MTRLPLTNFYVSSNFIRASYSSLSESSSFTNNSYRRLPCGRPMTTVVNDFPHQSFVATHRDKHVHKLSAHFQLRLTFSTQQQRVCLLLWRVRPNGTLTCLYEIDRISTSLSLLLLYFSCICIKKVLIF